MSELRIALDSGQIAFHRPDDLAEGFKLLGLATALLTAQLAAANQVNLAHAPSGLVIPRLAILPNGQ